MVKHSCPYENCTSTFSRPYRLRIHIQRHQGIKQFQCTQCDHGYHRKQHLQRHIAEIHQNQPRLDQPLSCDHCERQFDTAWGLRRHLAKIKEPKTRVRQHCCEICGRRFFKPDELERHSLKHERFKCVIPSCPLSARQFNWTFYVQHMADYHTEPFVCAHCGKHFLIKSQIRQHVRQHMPKFICTQEGCNRKFSFAKNLTHHIRVGHGERTYDCQLKGCDWKFKYKTCFDRHVRVHQQNGRIVAMANRNNKKEPKYLMANKLAAFALKI